MAVEAVVEEEEGVGARVEVREVEAGARTDIYLYHFFLLIL